MCRLKRSLSLSWRVDFTRIIQRIELGNEGGILLGRGDVGFYWGEEDVGFYWGEEDGIPQRIQPSIQSKIHQ